MDADGNIDSGADVSRADPLFYEKRDLLTNTWDEEVETIDYQDGQYHKGLRGQVAFWRKGVNPARLDEFDAWVAEVVEPHYLPLEVTE